MTQDEKYTKEFQKALNDYVKLGFNQDECSGFMHGFHKGAEAKQLILSGVSQQSELLMATLTSRVLTIQNEPDGIVRETMINNLLIDINCG